MRQHTRGKSRSAFIKLSGNSGLIENLSEIIGDAKWRSAWLLLIKSNNSWYIIDRIFWKRRNRNVPMIIVDDTPVDGKENFWLQNDLYYLKMEDKHILMDDKAWLNDRIMDAAQCLCVSCV